jgi:hypothetical protein
VHDLVAHADDVSPPNIWVPTAEIFGDLSSGFADRLDEMNQREAEVRAPRHRDHPFHAIVITCSKAS